MALTKEDQWLKNRDTATAIGQRSSSPAMTTLPELQAIQKNGFSWYPKSDPAPKKNYLPMGALVHSDSSKLSPKGQHWGASSMPGGGRGGGGGGGGGSMSPLPPLVEPVRRKSGRSGIGVSPQFDENNYKNAMKAYKQGQEMRRNRPDLQYRERLWNLQEAKLAAEEEKYGINPTANLFGTKYSSIRSRMIQRMNQLRGGK